MRYLILILGMTLIGFSSQAQKAMRDNSVVQQLDLERYLGTWYEIARYNHSFEKGLEGVTANYTMREDGKIRVINSGYKGGLDGKKSIAEGKAKVPNPQEPSKLKVSFFWIFYGDYFVMELDENYQWAVIGSKTDKYLWILSRTPQMEPYIYNDLLRRLKKRGYDVGKLILVKQKKNKS